MTELDQAAGGCRRPVTLDELEGPATDRLLAASGKDAGESLDAEVEHRDEIFVAADAAPGDLFEHRPILDER
jgi:hypothetical protein